MEVEINQITKNHVIPVKAPACLEGSEKGGRQESPKIRNHVIPAKAGISSLQFLYPVYFLVMVPDVFVEILQFRVKFIYQVVLPFPLPFLQLFLSCYSGFNVIEKFMI